MNLGQMVVVLLVLSLLIYLYAGTFGIDLTYMQALAGLAVLKGIALFLAPEKAPMVLVRDSNGKED